MALEIGVLNVLVGLGLADNAGSKLADDIGGAVGPAAEKAGKTISEKLSAGLDKAGGALTKGLTAPLLALGGGAIGAALSVDDALDGIRVSTGATGAELEQLGKDFETVAKTAAVPLDRVGSIVGDLNQRLGLTGKPLQDLATQVADLEQITGTPADLDAITRALAAFNVPADQAGATLDRIFRASQATGVGFNQLTGDLVSQSAAFSELGFGLDETAALLGQFEKAGVNTSTVLAGLRANIIKSTKGGADVAKLQADIEEGQTAVEETTLKLDAAQTKYNETLAKYGDGASQTKTAFASLVAAQNDVQTAADKAAQAQKALDDAVAASGANVGGAAAFFRSGVKEIEGFLAAGDDAGAQAKAKELFGAKTFLDALDAIKRGQFNIDPTLAQIQNGADTISGLAAETADFPEQFAKFKNDLAFQLAPLGQSLFPAISEALKTALPLIQQLFDKFNSLSPETQKLVVTVGAFAAGLGPVISTVAKIVPAISGIGKAISGLTTLLSANPWMLAALAAVAAAVLIYKNWDTIREWFADLWDWLAGAASAVWDAILGFTVAVAEAVIKAWNAVVRFFGRLWDGIVKGVKLVVGLSGIGLLVRAANIVRDRWDDIAKFFAGLWDSIRSGVTDTFNAIGTIAANIAGAIRGVWDGVAGFFADTFENVADTVSDVFGGIGDTIGGVAATVKGFVNGVIGGINAIIRAWNGLTFTVPGWDTVTVGGVPVLPAWDGLTITLPQVPTIPEFRALGGPIDANRPYVVGELGPELVLPRRPGQVISTADLAALSSGRGGDTFNVTVNNPRTEPTSTSLPAALRRAGYLRSR